MKNRISSLLALLITSAIVLAGCHEQPGDDADPASHAEIMEHARAVATDLDTPEEALAAGYLPGTVCEPQMGVHWVNPSLLGPELDPDQPDALLYLPGPGGVYDVMNSTFLGIEYLVITEDMETNSTETKPEFMGRPMDGPMAGHFPGMPWHVDLHIYLADGIESGEDLPADNPGIECPDGTTPPPPMTGVELNPVNAEGTVSDVRGWVNITEAPFVGMLTLDVTLTGFDSAGERAVHIHQNGDCGPSVDAEGNVTPGGAAGGHFNPDGSQHGAHAGDLPNVMIGEDGTGRMTVTADVLHAPLTLEEGAKYGITGRSIVVHAGADDGESQPAGDAGPRALCGVIG